MATVAAQPPTRTAAVEPAPNTGGYWIETGPGKKRLVTPESPARVRKMDNKHFDSINLAPATCQVGDWNRRFGGPGKGVKFYIDDHGVAKARFRDRAAKIAHMAERSGNTVHLVDFDEIRSR